MTRLSRKLTALAASGLLAVTVAGLATASPAQAADKTVFKVVGTTDVFDSHLVQEVIEPDFEAAHPDIDLQYISQGTGAAITTAKSGAASALLVHAASLENQFVADGYSTEQYGRAVFWGDYVLLGPKSDPAGVLTDAPHDVASAFEKVAAAGAQGKADFVSRGGTPGTTVQEHAIWKLTSGVNKCTVPDAQGGGSAPATTDGGTCAATDSARSYPSWYHVTAAGQSDNINNGNLCNYTNGGNGKTPDCYVFTDRGTFNYLQSQDLANRLQIVTRDNSSDARGGEPALVNSFHAYGINPDGITAHGGNASGVDTATAKVFLDFLTSASEQSKIGNYLGSGRQAAFIPSAAPKVTISSLPASVKKGDALQIKGSIANVVPGTPALDGVAVDLYGRQGDGTPVKLDSDTTNDTGGFTFDTTVDQTTTYSVAVPQITKIEDSTLSPQFGDILQASTQDIGTVPVVQPLPDSSITITKKTIKSGVLTVTGRVSPKTVSGARIQLYLGKGTATPTQYKSAITKAGASTFTYKYTIAKGKYTFYLRYAAPGVINESKTPTYPLTVS